jgi:hypothetical protein
MVRVVLFVAFALLSTVEAGVAPKHDENDRQPLSHVEDVQTSNASLVLDFLEPPSFMVPKDDILPLKGNSPNQWLMPQIFKRQATCTNYCGASTPKVSYCTCGQQCCGTACCATASGYVCCGGSGCCNTAANAFCCGASCCVNGATCNGNKACAFKT